MYSHRSAVYDRLYSLYIGLEGSVGAPVGVRDLDAEFHILAAKITFCHAVHLLILSGNYINSYIITDYYVNCKSF